MTEESTAENQSCMESLGSGAAEKKDDDSHGRNGPNDTVSERGTALGECASGAALHITSKTAAATSWSWVQTGIGESDGQLKCI